MSEYDYQNPVFVDITNDFIHAAEEWPLNGPTVLLAPRFDLEEAVSSVDLMHPKMDRGLIRAHEMSLPEFCNHALDQLLPTLPISQPTPPPELFLAFLQHLRILMVAWMSGHSFGDTLLTCLIVHRPNYLKNEPLAYFVHGTLRGCELLASIVSAASVASGEQFFTNLHSFPSSRHTPTLPQLMEWLLTFQRRMQQTERATILGPSQTSQGQIILKEFERLYAWLQLLKMIKETDLDYGLMIQLVNRLSQPFPPINTANHEQLLDGESGGNLSIPGNDHNNKRQDFLIEPLIANLFSLGCRRRTLHLPEASEAEAIWYGLMRRLHRMLNVLQGRPAYLDLAQLLLQSSIESSFALSAVLRSLLFAILLREGYMYGYLRPGHFAALSLALPAGDRQVEQVLLDALQILCHSPPRQRRLLPKCIRWFGEEMNYMTTRMRSILEEHYSWLAIWFVLLGFHLDLYEPHELVESHLVIHKLALSFLPSLALKASQMLEKMSMMTGTIGIIMRRNYHLQQVSHDACRLAHRWGCLYPLLGDPGWLKDELEAYGKSVLEVSQTLNPTVNLDSLEMDHKKEQEALSDVMTQSVLFESYLSTLLAPTVEDMPHFVRIAHYR